MTGRQAAMSTILEIERLSKIHEYRIVSVVKRVEQRLMASFARANLDPTRYSQAIRLQELNWLKGQYQQIIYGSARSVGAARQLSNSVVETHVAAFRSGYRLSGNELKPIIGIAKFPIIKPELATWISLYRPQLTGLMDHFSRDIYNSVVDKIQEGVLFGKHPDVIAKTLVNAGLPRGRFNVARTRAQLIARTEVPRAFNGGKLSMYKGVGVYYVKVVGGTMICEECAPYHDKVFPLSEVPFFPIHPNCSHTYIAWQREGIGYGLKD